MFQTFHLIDKYQKRSKINKEIDEKHRQRGYPEDNKSDVNQKCLGHLNMRVYLQQKYHILMTY